MTLNNTNKWDGTALAPSDFGTVGYGILMNATKTQIELFTYDPTTINAPQITIIARGLDYEGGTTSDPSRIFEWPRTETIVQLSPDAPQVFEWLKEYIDSVAVSGSPDASDTQKGIVTLSNSGTNTAVADNDPRVPSLNGAIFLNAMTGTIHMYGGVTAPAGFLMCDGASYNNFDYPGLLDVFRGRFGYDDGKEVTASSTLNEFTAAGHGLVNNQPVLFDSTEDLPEGVQPHTVYYVRGATGSTFRIATAPDGPTLPLLTNGSGTISVYPKFRVPNLEGRFPIGSGGALNQFSSSYVLQQNRPSRSSMFYVYADYVYFRYETPAWTDGQVVVFKGNAGSVPLNTPLYVRRRGTGNTEFHLYSSYEDYENNNHMTFTPGGYYSSTSTDEMRGISAQGIDFEDGGEVVFTGDVPSTLTEGTTYYVFRDLADSNSFQVATTRQNALDRVPIYISSGGGEVEVELQGRDGGVGQTGGAAVHSLTEGEMPAHSHDTGSSSRRTSGSSSSGDMRMVDGTGTRSGSTGGGLPHNNMPPYLAINFITKT